MIFTRNQNSRPKLADLDMPKPTEETRKTNKFNSMIENIASRFLLTCSAEVYIESVRARARDFELRSVQAKENDAGPCLGYVNCDQFPIYWMNAICEIGETTNV